MRAGQLPIDEQLTEFRAPLSRNPTLAGVLTRAAAMSLPGWYLVAGCLYQTVWNVVTGQPPEAGILDYDLAYFDASDLSWDAEDAAIQAGREVFSGLDVPVQIPNQARVHVWYEHKFGVPCPPHTSAEAAIDTFEATTACLGVRLLSDGIPSGVASPANSARAHPFLRFPARTPGPAGTTSPAAAALAGTTPAPPPRRRSHQARPAMLPGQSPLRVNDTTLGHAAA